MNDHDEETEEVPHFDLPVRPRRNRRTATLRRLVREHEVTTADLIWPLFIVEGKGVREPIGAMPGVSRLSIDEMVKEVREAAKLGIGAVALFPKIEDGLKDEHGTAALDPMGLVPLAVRALKDACPDVLVVTDVALDPYSSDGHDGVVHEGRVLNDETLPLLAGMAIVQAEAGADIVAPSDMMDGRIGFIRTALDEEGYEDVAILSYAAKYASGFYGPFREALDSAPRAGDKKTYQMDPANRREAIREVLMDVEEGADMVMVKPGMPYLDVIADVREEVEIPVAAYQVSGEYAMIHAAAQNGWLDLNTAMDEALLAFKRAGADLILSYAAKDFARRQRGAGR